MLAAYFGINTKKNTSEPEDDVGTLMMQFPQDLLVLPKGDLSIGSGKKKEVPSE